MRILFVCLGNICRSPMAEGVCRRLLEEEGLGGQVEVASAGTGSWHVGEPPDPRTLDTLRRHDIDFDGKRGHQVTPEMVHRADLVVAMDRSNLRRLRQMGAADARLLLDFVPGREGQDVPDPYYQGGFDHAYRLVEEGCRALVREIRQQV